MLIVNSFGLQNALERSAVDIGHFFARCYSSAVACATVMRDEMGPCGYLRYAPDSNYVQGSYAVLSLLKVKFHLDPCSFHPLIIRQLLRPEFKTFLDHESKIITLVNDVASVLEQAAAGPLHTPALYSCFLRALVSAKTEYPSSNSSISHMSNAPNGAVDTSHESSTSHSASMNNSYPFIANDPLSEFQFDGEMGPVADMSTFPPTMAPHPSEDHLGMLTMDSILSASFWDSVLVPGQSESASM
ncbi:hypothetical protein PHLCEN_2v7785 [Hermanssonia centrifuga]|uniref:Uncharacterized protein n=1 Tax=Hermanssonia centrifuga TaxID=98765 RepID=A0A2R6NVN5_9APHY|nr:hypothetical protein PHLCEN_2v7785 [Hermanssonia centrifuga]